MFNKCNQPPVSFPSTWKKSQSLAESSIQTEEVVRQEGSCQVTEMAEAGVQTEAEEDKGEGEGKYQLASLVAFLNRVVPKVEQELERQSRSQAFLRYSAQGEEDETSGVRLLHSLRWTHMPSECVAMGLAWSCTGAVVGVAYGSQLHDHWCHHQAGIALWNINRSDFDANQPERVLETSSCVMCLAFHPTNPAIFAAGTYSGEVAVYDLSHSEVVSAVAVGDCGGGVSTVAWRPAGEGSGGLAVVCTTSTGLVLVWALNLTKQQLTLEAGYLVEPQDVPRGLRTQLKESKGVGITSLSYSSQDQSLFILGTESGSMLVCSATSEVVTGEEFGGVGLRRCVGASLCPHAGQVLLAHFSPHHHHALLSAASDNQIRLYTLLQPNKAVVTVYSEEGVSCGQWSPSRPLVCALGLTSGHVALHDWGANPAQPFLTIPGPEKPSPVTTIQFNRKNMQLVAVGDQLGRACVWQLPLSAVSPQPSERTTLDSLLSTLAT